MDFKVFLKIIHLYKSGKTTREDFIYNWKIQQLVLGINPVDQRKV